MNAFDELYCKLNEKKLESGKVFHLTKEEHDSFTFKLDENYKIHVYQILPAHVPLVEELVYIDIIPDNKQQEPVYPHHFYLSYEDAYDFCIEIMEDNRLLENLKDNAKEQKEYKWLPFIVMWMFVFIGCMLLLYGLATLTMDMSEWRAWEIGVIIAAALPLTLVFTIFFLRFLSMPIEVEKDTVQKDTVQRSLSIGRGIAGYVVGTLMSLIGALLLLAIWAVPDSETPLYVNLSLTFGFGILIFVGIGLIWYTAKRKRYRKRGAVVKATEDDINK